MIPNKPSAWKKSCVNIKLNSFGGLSLLAYLKRPKPFNQLFHDGLGEDALIELKQLSSQINKMTGKNKTIQKYLTKISENYPIVVTESWAYKNFYNKLPKFLKDKLRFIKPTKYKWVLPSQFSSVRLIQAIKSHPDITKFPNSNIKVLIIDRSSVDVELIDQSISALKNFR